MIWSCLSTSAFLDVRRSALATPPCRRHTSATTTMSFLSWRVWLGAIALVAMTAADPTVAPANYTVTNQPTYVNVNIQIAVSRHGEMVPDASVMALTDEAANNVPVRYRHHELAHRSMLTPLADGHIGACIPRQRHQRAADTGRMHRLHFLRSLELSWQYRCRRRLPAS